MMSWQVRVVRFVKIFVQHTSMMHVCGNVIKGKVCLGEYTIQIKNTHILRTSSKKYACTSKHLPGTVKNNVSSLHQAIVQFPFVYMATKEQSTGQAMKDCLSKLMHQLRTLHMSTIGR